MRISALALAVAVWGVAAGASAQTLGYYQTPALGDDALVFASEGDLWRAPASGGTAVRLTTHEETESNPVISPDGKWIAFDASYDGPSEVYVMPVAGGAPVRLTHEGGGVTVRGWLDNSHVLYRTTNLPGTIPRQLRSIDRETLKTEAIPLDGADQATLLADGKTLVFTRYGLSMFSDNAVHYRGGRMAQLWRYTLGSDAEAVRLAADFGAPIRSPMAWNGRIYFVSDKSGTDNIWSVDEIGKDPVQHTQSTGWQMRTPYLKDGKIAYQSGADLYSYDIASGTTAKLALTLTSDSDSKRERWLESPLDFLSDARLAPSGESVSVTARGRFVTAFTGQRRRVEYAIPAGARARSAAMGGDGKAVYAIIDGGNFGEIWAFPADGRGEGKALTQGARDYIWRLFPAPKGNTLLYTTKRGKLMELDTATGKSTEIDKTASSADDAFQEFTWSADGRYLAYTGYDVRDMPQVILFDTKSRTRTVLTTGKYESSAPAFSADGAWLYFLSNRSFTPTPGAPWGDRNMGPSFGARGKLYALQLDPAADFPFEMPDELTAEAAAAKAAAEEAKTAKAGKKDKKAKDAPEEEKPETQAKVDLNGVQARLWEVPARAGDYVSLAANATHLFLLESTGNDSPPALKRLEIKAEKPEVADYAKGVQTFGLSTDGSKLFVLTGEGSEAKFLILDPKADFPEDPSSNLVRLADWRPAIDPHDEWRQMTLDAWRLHRDFAYDPKLRGVNWDGVRDHFVPLADRLGYRGELDDLLGQMSAELGILHSQIRPGETPVDDESGQPGFLGATYEAAPGGVKIVSILSGETDRPDTLGPLLKPGVDVKPGDVVTAVDGKAVASRDELMDALTMKADQQVRLDLLRGAAKRSEIVVPAPRRTESQLLYADWVQKNREAVAKASGGKIGYLHLRAMGAADVASFARDFYEHYDKDGLIIDVRGNRGGNIDSWIIGTLLRKVWAYWPGPDGTGGNSNMQQTFKGHLAVLINEGTYSDGETFSAGVKALELAPLIGTRTAGAGIWLSDRNPLVDGGQARVAEFAQYGADGRWLLEGNGVAPDIEVDTPPRAAYLGEDAQLARALSYLEGKIAEEPVARFTPRPLPPLGEPGQDVK
ncbi:S41 family peptidase [Hyphomonas sp.]|uniref:S41 family peptidase n=1 Tax=Hyphomonas sp. TaxID=87 RepID=UPI0025C574BD|nr:S41 family peptidase [Hyphomonas sp.]MBI1400810.1 peptidase S41 [Hyphomonas sp.]